jgi:hypothetical protein
VVEGELAFFTFDDAGQITSSHILGRECGWRRYSARRLAQDCGLDSACCLFRGKTWPLLGGERQGLCALGTQGRRPECREVFGVARIHGSRPRPERLRTANQRHDVATQGRRVAALPADGVRNNLEALDSVEQLAMRMLKKVVAVRAAKSHPVGETRGMWPTMQPVRPHRMRFNPCRGVYPRDGWQLEGDAPTRLQGCFTACSSSPSLAVS